MQFFYPVSRFGILLAATNLIPVPADAKPLVLEPTTPWMLDYAENHCRLARRFGEGKDSVLFIADRAGPQHSYRLTIAGDPLRSRERAGWPLTIGPIGEESEFSGFQGQVEDAGDAIVFPAFDWNIDDWLSVATAEAAIDPTENTLHENGVADFRWLEVGGLRGENVRLAMGSMIAPMKTMQDCVDSLVVDWGLDPETLKNLSRQPEPTGDIQDWIKPSEYPAVANARGQQGLLSVRLNVGPDGRVTQCAVQLQTTPADFDGAACEALIQRASFTPALDAEGNPVEAVWQTRVHFIQRNRAVMRTKGRIGRNRPRTQN